MKSSDNISNIGSATDYKQQTEANTGEIQPAKHHNQSALAKKNQ